MYAEIVAAGGAMVAISPQLQKYSKQVAHKHQLAFPVLADPGNVVAARFGLVFTLPDYLRPVYLGFGIDLVRFNGNDQWTLPLPGRFIIDRQRVIRHAEVDADYTHRPEPANIPVLLQELEGPV